MTESLPIDALLPQLRASLAQTPALVLVAPPGAGKTTRVPAALLDEPWAAGGTVVVLEPRRMAARAAARRVADERHCKLGAEVGYVVRLDRRRGPETRLLFVTEGVLLRRLQSDPLLEGVAAVVLDEFHERSLEADLALAFLREVQDLRPELRLLAMSATLKAEPLARYLGDCPVLESAGRAHPVAMHYLRSRGDRPLEGRLAWGVAQALADPEDDGGHVLCFLPGAAAIRRGAEALAGIAERQGLRILPLHGELPAAEQDAVLVPGGARRVILSTNVAETSLTVPGVSTVVDSGLARQLRYQVTTGLERLVEQPISRAAADQRAGRAGREGPGRVWRLWAQGEQHARPEHEVPEIQRVDLTAALLQVRAWGAADPTDFAWFEPPPAAALQRADGLLRLLGAVDSTGVTARGKRLLELPLHPRLGCMLLHAAERGCLREGAWLAALAAEREVLVGARAFGPDAPAVADEVGASDLLYRLERLRAAQRAGGSAAVLRSHGLNVRAARQVRAVAQRLEQLLARREGPGRRASEPGEAVLLEVLFSGFPDRVAVRREAPSDRLLIYGGRSARLSPRSVVRESKLLVAHRVDDAPRGTDAVVRLASQIDRALLERLRPGALVSETGLAFDAERERVVAWEEERYDRLVLQRRETAVADRIAAGALLAAQVQSRPRAALAPSPEVLEWLARLSLLGAVLPERGLPDGEDLLGRVGVALAAERISFAELRREPLLPWLVATLDGAQQQLLEREAPTHLKVPSGRLIALNYHQDPPVLAVKLQELFGLTETPRIAQGRVELLLHLLAPNRRPVQVTRDLASFWRRTYPEVRRELAGRYPKHPWPADPMGARPTAATRRRGRKPKR